MLRQRSAWITDAWGRVRLQWWYENQGPTRTTSHATRSVGHNPSPKSGRANPGGIPTLNGHHAGSEPRKLAERCAPQSEELPTPPCNACGEPATFVLDDASGKVSHLHCPACEWRQDYVLPPPDAVPFSLENGEQRVDEIPESRAAWRARVHGPGDQHSDVSGLRRTKMSSSARALQCGAWTHHA